MKYSLARQTQASRTQLGSNNQNTGPNVLLNCPNVGQLLDFLNLYKPKLLSTKRIIKGLTVLDPQCSEAILH